MMEEKSITINYTQGADWSVLKKEWKNVVQAAIDASKDSYAPYSNFNVGAALLNKDGSIVSGFNQENAAYPLCNCAEQVAIQRCFAINPKAAPYLIAIYAKGKTLVNKPVGPCGACRQVMLETEYRSKMPLRIIMVGNDRRFLMFENMTALLPFNFGPSDLI